MMETYTIQGQSKPVRFTGTLLASESTETATSLRWLELTVYRIDAGPRSGQYLLHRTGQSVVYHRPQTCGFGVATAGVNVPDDAEPCPVCSPRDIDSDTDYEVWLESPRHKVVQCPVPQDIEKALLIRRKDGSTFLSLPAGNLIAKACRIDAKLEAYFLVPDDL